MLRVISMFLHQLLGEKGDISTMRLMAIWSMFVASVIALHAVFACHDIKSGIIELVALFLGAGVAGKVSHKFAENKQPKDSNEKPD